MINWLNKQNKKHSYLFKKERELESCDMVDWFELALMQKNQWLNKRTAKLSPRKHKRQIFEFINQLEITEVTDSIAEEISEILEDDI